MNGSPTPEFGMNRGLRQGDPLSPFLYLLVAEGLNLLIKNAVELGLLEPFEIGKDRVPISHLQYSDDTIFIYSDKEENIKVIKRILRIFELVSGLKVNFDKSNLYGFNIEESVLRNNAADLG